MPEQEPNKQEQNPFQQILEKLNTMESTIKSLQEENTSMKAQFKDFSDFNASLLNQGGGTPKSEPDDKAKTERRQYLDKICREEMIK